MAAAFTMSFLKWTTWTPRSPRWSLMELKVLQAGTGIRPGTRWVLLDTFDLVGFLIELRHRVPGCDGTSIPETGL